MTMFRKKPIRELMLSVKDILNKDALSLVNQLLAEKSERPI
jgi:hypothetical protein